MLFTLLPLALHGQTQDALVCKSNTATGSMQIPCGIILGAPAPFNATVALSSSNSAVSVPSSVLIPAGSMGVGFTATVSWLQSTTQAVTLSGSADGQSRSFTLTLLPNGSSGSSAGLTLGSTSVSFGNVDLNTPSTQSVTLTSSGTDPLTISAGTLSGTGFSMSGVSFPLTLNAGQSATLEIQFDPTKAGAATGSVTLTSNASSGSTSTIGLSGTGQSSAYSVDLSWQAPTDSSDAIAGYNVYRAPSGSSSYQRLTSSPDSGSTYTDSTVASGSTYEYEVTTVDSAGNESTPSNVYTATVP